MPPHEHAYVKRTAEQTTALAREHAMAVIRNYHTHPRTRKFPDSRLFVMVPDG
jgi:hypothetical protein